MPTPRTTPRWRRRRSRPPRTWRPRSTRHQDRADGPPGRGRRHGDFGREINQLLTQFDKVNTAIVKGTIAGDDVTDYLDQRDNIVSKLSQEVGVSMIAARQRRRGALHRQRRRAVRQDGAHGQLRGDQHLYARHHRQCGLYRRCPGHRRQFRDADQVRQARWPRPIARQCYGHVSEPARRGRARPDRCLQGKSTSPAPRCPTCPVSSPIPARRRCPRARPSRSASPARSGCRLGRPGPGRQPKSAARRRDQRQRRLQIQHHRQRRLLDPAAAAHRQHGCVAAVRCNHARQAERQLDRLRVVVDELDRKPAQDRRRQRPTTRIRCSTAAPRRCRTSAASTWTTRCR